METLIIIAGGLIGGGTSFQKNFLSVWIWFINTIFALVPALALTPLVSSMLSSLPLPAHLRAPAAFFGLFIAGLIILFKITEQILPRPDDIDKYPVLPGKLCGAVCGFLMGCCYASIIVYLAGSIPALSKKIPSEKFRSAGINTLYRISYGSTFQSMPDEKTRLKAMNALPSSQPPAQKAPQDNSQNDQGRQNPETNQETSAPRQKTQQEIDREMLQRIEQVQNGQGYNDRGMQQDSFRDSFRTGGRNRHGRRRQSSNSGSSSGNIQAENMARQMTSSGAAAEKDPALSGAVVPIPTQQDVRNASRQTRHSLPSSGSNP